MFAPCPNGPVGEGVAKLLFELQLTWRSVSTVPSAAVTMAWAVVAPPSNTVSAPSVTATAVAGFTTVTVACPEAVPWDAVIVAVHDPLPTGHAPAVTSAVSCTAPLPETLATPEADDDHESGRLLITVPSAAVAVAVSVT
jgi:hypothetical protein